MQAHHTPTDGGSPPGPPAQHDDGYDDALTRFTDAVVALADDIHSASIPTWQPVTGLQVLFLTSVARGDRVTRSDLMRDRRTSGSAIVPGLASLVRQGFVAETPDGPESLLTLGPAGRELLTRINRARTAHVRQALTGTTQLNAEHVDRLTTALQRVRVATDVAR
jgi:DNA-binding MarR family transcriptional regulator